MENNNNNNIENFYYNIENNNEKNEAAPPQNFYIINNTINNEKNNNINNELYNNTNNAINNNNNINNNFNNEYYITPENNIEDETNIIRCKNCKQIPLINITNTCKNLFINFDCLCESKNNYFNINEYNKYIQFNSLHKIICSNFNEHENKNINKYSTFYCFDHKTFYCSNCIKNHNIFCKEHKLIKLKYLDSNCMNHPENKFIGYCKTCSINFCEKCKHNNNEHKIILFKEILISGDELEKYRENILKIKDSINKLEDIKNIIILNYEKYMKNLEEKFQIFKEKYLNLYDLLEKIIKSYEIMTYNSKIINNVNNNFQYINYNLIMNMRNNFNDFNFPNINNINIKNTDLYSLNINYGKLTFIFENFCYKNIKKKSNNEKEKEDLNYIENINTIKICKNYINTIIELHNNYIAVCSSDDMINIFNNNNNNFEKVININNYIGGVWDICETYNYRILASYGNEQAHIKIFNINYDNNTYNIEYNLEFHLGYILKILQLSYKNYICYCSCDYTINFYEINNDNNNNNNYIKKYYFTELSSVISILEIKFKNILISVNSNGQLSSYDIINRKKINMMNDVYCNEKNCLIQFNFDEILIGCFNEIKIINVDNFNILSNIVYNKQNLNCVININVNKILVGNNNENNNNLKTNFKSGIEIKNKGLIILGTFDGNLKIYKYIINN